MKQKLLKILAVVALTLFALITWPWPEKKTPHATTSAKTEKNSTESRKPLRNGDPNFKPVPVKKPEPSENKKAFRVTNPDAIAFNETQEQALEQGPGLTPALTEEEITNSPQLQSVVKALNNPVENGSAISPLKAPMLFDKDKFANDDAWRQKYLTSAEPARAFKSDPNSNIKIERVSPYYLEVEQGQEVQIQVKIGKSQPASILSADLGQIKESGLTFATVISDASSGIATFTFKGVKGTFGDSNITVASPSARGKLKFVVHTKIPKKEISDNQK